MSREANLEKAQEWLNTAIRQKYGNVNSFAKAIGYPRSSVVHWLNDVGTLPLHAFSAIVDVLGYNAVSMLFLDSESQPESAILSKDEHEIIRKYREDGIYREMIKKIM